MDRRLLKGPPVMDAVLSTKALLGPAAGLDHRWTLAAMAAEPSMGQLIELETAPPDRHHGLLEFADRNGVGPIGAHRILQHQPDSPARGRAQEMHDRSAARMNTLLNALDDIAARLAARHIRVVALKNGGIARGLHPCAACCPMGDLDLLVEKSRFTEAHAELQAGGFDLATRGTVEPADLDEGMASGGTEYLRRVDGEVVWIELQWRPIAGRWIRPEQEPGADELLERSVPITGTDVRLLDPVDNMVQVCLHTAKHSFVRAPGIRLHTDVDRLARWMRPDWTDVVERTTVLRSRTAVYLSLAIAQSLLDAPVPVPVLEALRPPPVQRDVLVNWLRRAGLFEPEDRKFTRAGMLAFHALLYDDRRTLASSILDTDPGDMTLRRAPELMAAGARRIRDVATRYQP